MRLSMGTVTRQAGPVAGKSLACPGPIGRWDWAMQGSLALAMVNSLDFNPPAGRSYLGLGWGVVSRKVRLLFLVLSGW